MCSAPWYWKTRRISAGATDDQQVADEDDDADEALDEVLDQDAARRGWQRSSRPAPANSGSSTNSPIAIAMVIANVTRERAAAHGHALAGRRKRARAHQPAGADDERLVEHDDAAEERRAREPVAVQEAVERLLRREDLALGAAHGDADGVRGRASARPRGVPGRRRRNAPSSVGCRHAGSALPTSRLRGVRSAPSARGASGSARPGRPCRRSSACPCRTGGSWSRRRRAARDASSRR